MGYWVQNKKRTPVQRTSKLAIEYYLFGGTIHITFVLVFNRYFFLKDFPENALVKNHKSLIMS